MLVKTHSKVRPNRPNGRTLGEAGVANAQSMNSLAAMAIALIPTVTGRAFNVVIDEKRGLPSAAVTCDDLPVSVFGACTDAHQLRTQSG